MLTPLKRVRMEKGMKQWEFAQILGITQAELSYYELNRRRCPTDMRYRIAKLLETPVDVLFPEKKRDL